MTRKITFVLALAALLLASCSTHTSSSAELSFALGTEAAQKIIKAARSAQYDTVSSQTDSESKDFAITLYLGEVESPNTTENQDYFYVYDSKKVSENELSEVKFSYTDVPAHTKLYLSISVYYKEKCLATYNKQDIVLSSGKNTLTLPLTLSYVPQTKYVLTKYDAQYSNCTLYLADNPYDSVENLEPQIYVTAGSYYGIDAFPTYCFDAYGYLYALSFEEETCIIKTNNPFFKDDDAQNGSTQTATAGYIAAQVEDKKFITLACDLKTNTLYALTYTNESNSAVIYKSTLPSEKEAEWTSYKVTCKSGLAIENAQFDVYDGVAYFAITDMEGGNPRYAAKKALSEAESTATNSQSEFDYELSITDNDMIDISQNLASPDDNQTALITDIRFQNKMLYLLFRDVHYFSDGYDGSLRSQGALIGVDFSKKTSTIYGLAGKQIEKQAIPNMYVSDTDKTILYDKSSQATDRAKLLIDGTKILKESEGKEVPIYTAFPDVYGPKSTQTTLSTNNFYGPLRFIALSPKKLVIADGGYAFYTDAQNALSHKLVNRAVTVDLESFAFSTQELNSVFTTAEKTTICGTKSLQELSGGYGSFFYTNFYKENGTSVSADNVYLAVPLDE